MGIEPLIASLPGLATMIGIASGSVSLIVAAFRGVRAFRARRAAQRAPTKAAAVSPTAHVEQPPPAPPANASPPVEAPRIRTPDQRLRVFVSSTLQELADERAAARQAITRLRLSPIMFETGARPHPPRSLYRAYLEQSDVFVGIYWQRYGWVAPGEQVSGLEDEYRLAGDRPKLIYLKTPANDREPGLTALLDRIRADDHASYKSFKTIAELRRLIADDLALLLTERFAIRPAESAQVAAHASVPVDTNLPVPPTRLIGREHELATVEHLIDSHRLVTLTGAGGSGKTRLAIEVGHELRARFPDGVWFVDLVPIADANLVVPTIAQTLGVVDTGTLSLVMSVADQVRSKRLLLIIDNFEHVLPAAPALANLLAASETPRILVTSREPLRLHGEQELPVSPLPLPDPNSDPSEVDLADVPSVALFTAAARAIKPDFALSTENAPAVVEICRRLDGLPLAIELAAARVRLLPPKALLARLQTDGQGPLALLTGGAKDLAQRQSTLRATIDWSYRLLEPAEKALFRRLGVFAGGFDLEAATAISSAGAALEVDPLDGLASLTAKSLVRQEEVEGEPRFLLLMTLRDFALETLRAGSQLEAVARVHANYFVSLAEQLESHMGGPEHAACFDRLEREQDNLRAAFAWLVAHCEVQEGLRLAAALWIYWREHASIAEGRAACQAILALAPDSLRTVARLKVFLAAGNFAMLQGDYPNAEDALTSALALSREMNDERGLGAALAFLGVLESRRGRWAEARHALEESLAIRRRRGDRANEASVLNDLGTLAQVEHNYPRARAYYEDALRVWRETGNAGPPTSALVNLGTMVHRLGDDERALDLLHEALGGARRFGDRLNVAFVLEGLGRVSAARGSASRATRLLGAAAALRRSGGVPLTDFDRQELEQIMGQCRQTMGDEDFARAYAEGEEMTPDQVVAYAQEEGVAELSSA